MKYELFRNAAGKWRYRLLERELHLVTGLAEKAVTRPPYFQIDSTGIAVGEGYVWDGPSGPAADSPTGMRASLFHDVLYQALREELLPRTWANRRKADRVLFAIAAEAGMLWPRRAYWYVSLRLVGWYSARWSSG